MNSYTTSVSNLSENIEHFSSKFDSLMNNLIKFVGFENVTSSIPKQTTS